MRVVVCGSRSWADQTKIRKHLRELPPDTLVIHGGARGADQLAAEVATQLGMRVQQVDADWRRHGKGAGAVRNREMLNMNPDYVIAFWDGKSPGTRNTIEQANNYALRVIIVTPD